MLNSLLPNYGKHARHLAFVLVLLCTTALQAQAQFGGAGAPSATFSHTFSPKQGLKVGDIITLEFSATPDAASYYIYSAKEPPAPANLPTKVSLDGESVDVELVGGTVDGAEPKTKYEDVFGTDVYYFDKKGVYRQQVRITGPNPKIVGYVRYQVCDPSNCVPGTYEFTIELGAVQAAAQPQNNTANTEQQANNSNPENEPEDGTDADSTDQAAATSDSTSDSAPGQSATPADIFSVNNYDGSADTKGKNVLVIFLIGMLGGFAAIFTPCVYPMIPLTVSIFTKQSKNPSEGKRNALLYALSIIIIYVVIGLLISAIFGSDTLYKMSTSPWVNLVFFVLLVVFGISFLGAFEIMLPTSWANRIDQLTRTKDGKTKSGFLPIFFMALTLAIVSFSCTGPLVGNVLFEAANGGSFIAPTMGMLGFAVALAIPFGLLALFPGWLNSMPRSGGWLNAVKVTLGFLELALALKFLSNADLVWHTGILDREIYIAGWIVIGTLLGIYLLGKLRLPKDSPVEKISVSRLMLAIATFWFVVYMIPGLWGAPLKMLSGFLPPVNEDMGVIVLGEELPCNLPSERKYLSTLGHATPRGYCTFYDLEEGLNYARQVGKPVFLDFTGHTCVNCRQVEANVWSDARVRKILTEDYVMISLFTDDSTPLEKTVTLPSGKKLRTVGDMWQHFESEAFNKIAQPYYVLMDEDRNVLVPPRDYSLDVEGYIKFLNSGLAAYQGRE